MLPPAAGWLVAEFLSSLTSVSDNTTLVNFDARRKGLGIWQLHMRSSGPTPVAIELAP